MDGESATVPRRAGWFADVSKIEIAAFALWVGVEFALALSATLILVHKTLSLPTNARFPSQFVIRWAVTWGGAMVLAAVMAGALVFRRTAPWRAIVIWPLLVGVAVGLGYFFGVMNQMHPGSPFCPHEADDPCAYSFEIPGAGLSVVAALVLGGAFAAVASLRRVLLRRISLGPPRTR